MPSPIRLVLKYIEPRVFFFLFSLHTLHTSIARNTQLTGAHSVKYRDPEENANTARVVMFASTVKRLSVLAMEEGKEVWPLRAGETRCKAPDSKDGLCSRWAVLQRWTWIVNENS